MGNTYKDHSRRLWATAGSLEPSFEALNLGCLQRIADATELAAKNHDQLQRRAEWAESRMKDLQAEVDRLRHSNAALRGHLKRIKRSR